MLKRCWKTRNFKFTDNYHY